MIKTIVIDDEPSAIGVIDSLLESYADRVEVCARCNTVEDAVKSVKKFAPDLLFLDVELSDGSGFEVIEHFPDLSCRIIFVTAFEHYALKAIKHHAFDYIMKPIDPTEFGATMEKVCSDIRNEEPVKENKDLLRFMYEAMQNKIAVPTRHGFQYLEIDEILMISGEGSYARVRFLNGNEMVVTKIIKDFEQILKDRGFLRVHKSYLVNLRYIEELRKDDSGYLVMKEGIRVPISLKDKDQILNSLRAYSNMV